jgi:signal transduction histidine kinase
VNLTIGRSGFFNLFCGCEGTYLSVQPMKISHYILLSFLLILLLFSLTTYINIQLTKKVNENAEYVSKSGAIVRNTGRFQRNILSSVSGLRGYLITGEKYFIESYDSAAKENETILQDLSVLIPDSSVQRGRLNEIIKLNNMWMDEFAEPLKQAKQLAIVNDTNLSYFNRLYREKLLTGDEYKIQRRLQEKFRDFSNYEYETREKRRRQLDASVRATSRFTFLLTAFSVIMGFIIVAFLTYRISARIMKMVRMANDIASGNYSVNVKDDSKDELSNLSQSLNHMAAELSGNIRELKRKNEELDQFAHIVSHDLKGPLRGIDNVVTWIEEDHATEISEKMNDYLQLIKGRIVRAENLIQGILEYARTGKEIMGNELVDINQLLGEIIENIPVCSLHFIIQKNMPVMYTERTPLLQIFSNLILNAVKYHDKPDGEVRVYSKEHPGYYEFFVEDNGPGIAQIYHDRIFVIFQTLKDRDSFESTGVGLAIVKKILDARKEKIRILSAPGKGSTFSFTWKKNTSNGEDN